MIARGVIFRAIWKWRFEALGRKKKLDPVVQEILYGKYQPKKIEWLEEVPNQIKGVNIPFSMLLPDVRSGKKRQTVRRLSDRRLRIGKGTVLHFFKNWRTPNRQKIGDGMCTGRTIPLLIWDFTEEFALADGFQPEGQKTAVDNMRLWFLETHKRYDPANAEFVGIRWIPLWLEPLVSSLDRWI